MIVLTESDAWILLLYIVQNTFVFVNEAVHKNNKTGRPKAEHLSLIIDCIILSQPIL